MDVRPFNEIFLRSNVFVYFVSDRSNRLAFNFDCFNVNELGVTIVSVKKRCALVDGVGWIGVAVERGLATSPCIYGFGAF